MSSKPSIVTETHPNCHLCVRSKTVKDDFEFDYRLKFLNFYAKRLDILAFHG